MLVALTVVTGAGAIITARIINNRQAEKIETLRNENLKLEAKVAPRRLNGTQKESLAKFLENDPGAVAIVSSIQDPESSDFADDFESSLRDAHWQTARIRNHTEGAGVQYGVSVGTFVGTSLGDTKRLSDALVAIEYRTTKRRSVPRMKKPCHHISKLESYIW